MIDQDTSMTDILAAVGRCDDQACVEFVRRQGRENYPTLQATLSAMWRGVWSAQWADVERMRRWKHPERISPLDPGVLKAIMQGAERNDDEAMRIAFEGLSLELIATAGSIHAKLRLTLDAERNRNSAAAVPRISFETQE